MVVDEIGDSADLARLARTSRPFQEPALNKLWKTVVGLEPLLRTLPTNLYEEVEVGATTGEIYGHMMMYIPRASRNTLTLAVRSSALGLLELY